MEKIKNKALIKILADFRVNKKNAQSLIVD